MLGSKKDKVFTLFDIANAILCILCFFIIVVGTQKFGPGVTHDSVAYLFAASSVANGNGLQYFAYTSPFIQWPPLFPLILSIPNLLSIEPLTFSLYFNALGMSLALWVGSRTVRSLTKYSFMPTLFILMGLLSFPLLRMSFFVWSEPLFILLTAIVFHILLTTDFNRINKHGYVRPVVLMAMITALACLTRYIGVVVIAVVCLYLLVKIKGLRNKIKSVFLYGAVSSVPTVLFIVRNYIVSGTLVGMRSPSGISMTTNVQRAVKTVAGWLFPVVAEPETLQRPLYYGVLAICILLSLLFLWQIIVSPRKRLALLFLLSFCIVYSVYMVVSATKVAFDPISDRYMIPVMVPLLTWLVLILDGFLENIASSWTSSALIKKVLNSMMSIILAGFLLYSLTANAIILKDSTLKATREGAGGFHTTYWKQHSFLGQMSQLEDSDMIYTNDPSAVHFLTGKPVHYTPKTFGLPLYGYETFLKESENYHKKTIIWFGKEVSTTLYTPQQFSEDFTVSEIYKNEAFSMYTLERKGL